MPIINVPNFTPQVGNMPYGNCYANTFTLECASDGSIIGARGKPVPKVNDEIVLGHLFQGSRIHECICIVENPAAGSTTIDLGFTYVDEQDSKEVPQDKAFFFAGKSAAAAARFLSESKKLIELPKNANLVLTWKGAQSSKACKIHVTVISEQLGIV